MPEFLPGAIFVGILTALSAILLRAPAQKPSLSFFKVVLIGVAGVYPIPPVGAFQGPDATQPGHQYL